MIARPRLLPISMAVLTTGPQHTLIALDNAAACFLAADLSAASGVRELQAGKAGRHAPLPHPTSGTAFNLLHVANVGVSEAVALAPGLVFIKAGPIALKPVAARLGLQAFHPVQLH